MNLDKFLKHPLLKSSIIYTVSDAINSAVPFFILPVLSFYLVPADYGIVANFNILLSIISIFIVVGVDSAISASYFKLSHQELSKYIFNGIVIIIVSTIIISLLVFLFNKTIYSFVRIPLSYQLATIFMAMTMAFANVNLSLWRLEEKAFKFGAYQISQTFLNTGLSLLLVVVYQLGWIGRVNGMIITSISFGLLSLIILYRRGFINFKYNLQLISGILAFGLPLIPHMLSFWLRSGVDRILITKYIGESATGLYATGFQFGILISFLTGAFNNAFVPYMYKLLSEKDEKKLAKNKENLKKLIMIGVGLLVFLCILFTFVSKIILVNFFSERYTSASQFIFWAVLAQTFQGMYLFFVNYIFFMKKTKGLATITFSCAMLQIILSYIFVRTIGAIGAAYATAIVSFINFVIVAWYSNKVFPMGWFNKKIMFK
jgi:O-antigen/teichoic acid export membrane protein